MHPALHCAAHHQQRIHHHPWHPAAPAPAPSSSPRPPLSILRRRRRECCAMLCCRAPAPLSPRGSGTSAIASQPGFPAPATEQFQGERAPPHRTPCLHLPLRRLPLLLPLPPPPSRRPPGHQPHSCLLLCATLMQPRSLGLDWIGSGLGHPCLTLSLRLALALIASRVFPAVAASIMPAAAPPRLARSHPL